MTRAAKAKEKIVGYRIVGRRHVRLDYEDGQGTTFPFPFDFTDDHCDAAWRARYAPERLSKEQAMELADIADAYKTMITHPARSVAEQIFAVRRAFRAEVEKRR